VSGIDKWRNEDKVALAVLFVNRTSRGYRALLPAPDLWNRPEGCGRRAHLGRELAHAAEALSRVFLLFRGLARLVAKAGYPKPAKGAHHP
jgi:hypothetical protein